MAECIQVIVWPEIVDLRKQETPIHQRRSDTVGLVDSIVQIADGGHFCWLHGDGNTGDIQRDGMLKASAM